MSNTEFVQGLAKCKEGKFEEAISLFNRSLLLQPKHVPSLYNRAKAYHHIGKFHEAVADFNVLVQLEPSNADFYGDRGVALHMAKQSTQALADFDKAAALEPANAYRYSSRAFIKASVGDVFGAIDDYQKCLELDPEDAIAYNNLGMLEQQLGYQKSAKENFKKADNLTMGEKDSYRKSIIYESKPLSDNEQQDRQLQASAIPERQPVEKNAATTTGLATHYWQTLRKVLTQRETFQEFIDFLINSFQKNR